MLRSRVLLRSFSGHPRLNQLVELGWREKIDENVISAFNKLNQLESRIEKIEKKNITTDDLDTPILIFQKSNKSQESKESQDPTKGNYEIDFTITKAGAVAGFVFPTLFYFIFKLFHI